jgi:superfamily II DNA/RNA helicase
MSPTRELAQQIDQAMQGFGYYLDGVSSVAVYGGNDGNRYEQELRGMRLGADVLIATPGRLLSHLKVGNLNLSRCSFFVLDAADRMLDMGFIDDIMKIVQQLPQSCQRIMFSATMPPKIRELAVQLLHNPVEVKIAVSKPAEKIRQSAYVCYDPQKLKIINHIFKQGDLQRVIIFSGKKEKVKEITRSLKQMHINCDQMHSDLTQQERDEVMYRFKSGQTDVLVATDIVARGIDIDDIRIVINYDVPHDAEDYVHRIGRTARADRDGEAITFISEADIYRFQQIEHFLGKEVEKTPLPEGIGEGPEYIKREKKRSNTRRHGRWHSKGNGQNNQTKNLGKSSESKKRRRHRPKKNDSTPNT